MNFYKQMLPLSCFVMFFLIIPKSCNGTTVGGAILSSSATVSGGINVSSMTVSSVSVNNLMNSQGITTGISGRVVQLKLSSTTVATSVSTTSFAAVANIQQSIALSNANNYVQISLSGNLSTVLNGAQPAYITIYRDSINLGDNNYGLSVVTTGVSIGPTLYLRPVGIRMIDSPGDTNSHTYQAYIRVGTIGNSADFPSYGTGVLILQEVSQ